jgi:hypothetical protein
MTTRTELIAWLRREVKDSTYPPTDEPEAMMLAAADMLEADGKLRAAIRLALENHSGNYELNDAECDKHSAAVELLCQAKNLSHK